jgi:hypothetical protein
VAISRINFRPAAVLAGSIRGLGPYAAIELILPGGSLIALSVWALRDRPWATTELRRVLVTVALVAVALIFPREA